MINSKNSVEHEGRYKEDGWMIDRWACSCGWESKPYFGGALPALKMKQPPSAPRTPPHDGH